MSEDHGPLSGDDEVFRVVSLPFQCHQRYENFSPTREDACKQRVPELDHRIMYGFQSACCYAEDGHEHGRQDHGNDADRVLRST